MVSESITFDKADHFLAALFINRGLVHTRTVVGHYSELLPKILDSDQANMNYLELGGEKLILLQNCLKSKKDFSNLFNMCFKEGIVINMQSIFIDLYNLCDYYSTIDHYGKKRFKVHPQVYRDVVKTKYLLTERGKQFNLNLITNPYHHVPIEMGTSLQSIRTG